MTSRLYSFVNMYTQGIHAGIQTAHAVHEMGRKYQRRIDSDGEKNQSDYQKLYIYNRWADVDKTIWVKNGGDSAALNALYKKLTHFSTVFNLPLVKFKEPGLERATTAVSIVVTDELYNYNIFWANEATDQANLVRLLAEYKRFAS